ncbi:MAG: hypothetical protein WC441_03275 [Patescibacteria group bacterium]
MNEMCAALGKGHEFFLALKKAGFTDELCQEIINSRDNALAKKMYAVVTGQIDPVKIDVNSAKPEQSGFLLKIDYSLTLEQMIAAGRYDWNNGDVNARNFPLPVELSGQSLQVQAKLFHFGHSISSQKAIEEMDKQGYRPATLVELLALGASYPDLQRKFPIIALGSIWQNANGNRDAPFLDVDDNRRELNLNWFDNDWVGRCRFLAVCK